MPLSEDEQRILRQIEEDLEQDPSFASGSYRMSRGRAALLAAALAVGLVITIGGLAVNFAVSFVGFIVVLVAAAKLEAELRLIGRDRLGSLPVSAWINANRPSQRSDQVD